MEFKLIFKREPGNLACAARIAIEDVGLKDLDTARITLGSVITPENMHDNTYFLEENPTIFLTEKQARETGLFAEKCRAAVHGNSPKQMNGFYEKKYKKRGGGPVETRYVLNEKKLWEAWRKAGFPLNWGASPEPRGPKVPAEFEFIHEQDYTCGGSSNTVREYRHKPTGMEFVLLPGGSFSMGSNRGYGDEKPVHKVTVKPFFASKTVVTQMVWHKVMGTTPWEGKDYVKEGDNYPATHVSSVDAEEFCEKVNLRLGSESEWEYAYRAGTKTKYYWGDSMDKDYAWYDENTWDVGNKYAHQVATRKPNAFGLFDMSGNVYEWCQDSWHDNHNGAPDDGSAREPISGCYCVSRGGSFRGERTTFFRAAFRVKFLRDLLTPEIGFRLFRSL